MMNFRIVFLGGLLCLTSLFMGCQRANLKMSGEVFSKKGNVGLVWAANSLNADVYREGGSGLLDQALNDMTSGPFPEAIKSIALTPIVDEGYLKKYGDRLGKRNVKASLIQLPLDKQNFKKFDKSHDQEFEFDLRSFKDQYGLDYVVYVEVSKFGITRSYYGFIPTSGPKTTYQLDIYVVDTSTNMISAEYHREQKVDLQGKWDNPPDFSEAVEAMKGSLIQGFEEAYGEIFNGYY